MYGTFFILLCETQLAPFLYYICMSYGVYGRLTVIKIFFFLAEHYELYMIFIGGGRTQM